MKKAILTLLVAIVSCTGAFAQAGKSAVGINVGAGIGIGDAKDFNNIDLGLKYQYGLTDAIRLEAVFNYGIGLDKDFGGFKMKNDVMIYGINAHWIVNPESAFKFYPVVGIGGGTITAKAGGYSDSATGFMYNVGVGGEYSLTDNLALGLEIKFQSILKDGSYNRLPISLGLSYKF